MAEIEIGTVKLPSGMLLLVDPQTLAEPEAGDGLAGIVENLPDTPLRVFVTPSDVGPWIDALRIAVEPVADGQDEQESVLIPMVHQLVIIDGDASDDLEVDPGSHYGELVAALGEAPAAIKTIASIDGATVGLAMIALQAVEDRYEVMVRRRADGTVTQIAVRF